MTDENGKKLNRILVLDFETKDPLLKVAGPGWATGKQTVIGGSFLPYVEEEVILHNPVWLESEAQIKELVDNADVLVAHNAQYDLGILHKMGINIFNKKVIDTMLLAQLYDNTLNTRYKGMDPDMIGYSLKSLSMRYFNDRKHIDEIGVFVRDQGLYTDSKGKNIKTKDLGKCTKWAYENLDLVFNHSEEGKKLVTSYCDQDVVLCNKLYQFFIKFPEYVSEDWIHRISELTKFLVQSRDKGISVSRKRLLEVRDQLEIKEKEALQECKNILENCTPTAENEDDLFEQVNFVNKFNPEKRGDLYRAVKELKIPYEIKKKTQQPILDKGWLAKQQHPFCEQLREYRRHLKVRRDFCDKILSLANVLGQSKKNSVIKLYPTFNIFGAETGRFSSNKPNLQQIPAHGDLGPLIRSCFIPDDGYDMFQMDYGQQEFRLFSHFCYVTDIDPILKLEYDKDPRRDCHDLVATLTFGLNESSDVHPMRHVAKVINLASLYGMGRIKQSLKLKENGLTQLEAENMYDKYHMQFPSVKKFSKYCANLLKKRGYVKTLLGRKSRLDKPYLDPETGDLITFEYQAISKVIQGGAADQMMETIVKCREQGLDKYLLFSIHDQIVGQVPKGDPENIAGRIQEIMLNSVKLSVPMTADLGYGPNWAETEKVKH
jgi:DNA polymerase I-like protein with 3'-5' exonuclease and polymerase domains